MAVSRARLTCPALQPARRDNPVERRPPFGKKDRPVDPARPNADRGGPGSVSIGRGQMRLDLLVAADRRKPERSVKSPAGNPQRPVKPPGSARSCPRAGVPATLSAAMSIVARPPLGSKIWPLEVNGPSRDWPLAR